MSVLKEIQQFFKCGFIRQDKKTSKYEVRDLVNLEQIIIPFFFFFFQKKNQNQLRTQKNQDFKVFCKICELIRKKEHLHSVGVLKLLDLAYSMNQNDVNHRKTKQSLLDELELVPNCEFEKRFEKNLPICSKVKV